MVVHLFGLCAPMDEIKKVAGDIPLVEDGACAAGAAYDGIYAGGLFNWMLFFSPKKINYYRRGGMITTNENEIAGKIKVLRNHGASISEEQRHQGDKPYLLPDFNVLGFNYRMTDLQGALGGVQLKKLEKFIEQRKKWAQYYINELSSLDWLKLPIHSEKIQTRVAKFCYAR